MPFVLMITDLALVMTMAGSFLELVNLFPRAFFDVSNPNPNETRLTSRRIGFCIIVIALLGTRFVTPRWPGLDWRIFRPVIKSSQQPLAVFCVGVFLALVVTLRVEKDSNALWAQMAVSVTRILLMTSVAYYAEHDISWSDSGELNGNSNAKRT